MDSALESRPPTCQYAGIPDLMEKWLDGRYRAIAIGLLNPLVKDLVDPNLLPPLPFRFHANLGIPTVPSRCANPCLKCGSSTSGASGPSTPAPTTTATSRSTQHWPVPASSRGASLCWPYSSQASIAILTALGELVSRHLHLRPMLGLCRPRSATRRFPYLAAQFRPAHAGLAGGGESARSAFRIGNRRQSDPPVPRPNPRTRSGHAGPDAPNRRLALPTTVFGARSLCRN